MASKNLAAVRANAGKSYRQIWAEQDAARKAASQPNSAWGYAGQPLYVDAQANGGLSPQHRVPVPGVGTRARFENGQVGWYGMHGERLNDDQVAQADARLSGVPSTMDAARASVKAGIQAVPKTWGDVDRNIGAGAQGTSDWLQYGTIPGFHFNGNSADRNRWDQWNTTQALNNGGNPGAQRVVNRVFGDVPLLLSGPGHAVALSEQYDANSQAARQHLAAASEATDPSVAAAHRAQAEALARQNIQIAQQVQAGVGLGPDGVLTHLTQAAGYQAGGQPALARQTMNQTVQGALNLAKAHPLVFAANFVPEAAGGFALSREALGFASKVGAAGIDSLASKALADAGAATDSATASRLYDTAGKLQQLSYQMKQGRPLNAIRVMAGKAVESDGLNASRMPAPVTGIRQSAPPGSFPKAPVRYVPPSPPQSKPVPSASPVKTGDVSVGEPVDTVGRYDLTKAAPGLGSSPPNFTWDDWATGKVNPGEQVPATTIAGSRIAAAVPSSQVSAPNLTPPPVGKLGPGLTVRAYHPDVHSYLVNSGFSSIERHTNGSTTYSRPIDPSMSGANDDTGSVPSSGQNIPSVDDRPLFLPVSLPYNEAPGILGYQKHHLEPIYGGDYSGYKSANTIYVRNDNSGGKVPGGINFHTGPDGIHDTLDQALDDMGYSKQDYRQMTVEQKNPILTSVYKSLGIPYSNG